MRLRNGVMAALLLAGWSGAALAQGRLLTGSVTDSISGEPVVGARVSVRGTPLGASVGGDGRFSLLNVPTGRISVLVRAIGYKSREVVLESGQNTIDVTLVRDVLQLEEVVVTGQATQIARRNLPNAVAIVSAEDMARAPAASLEQALQGKVAGADIQSNSGAPGGGLQVRMRGVTSINAASEPLYVVDGVVVSNVAIPSNANAVTRAASGSNPALTQDNQVNRIADLNQADIENIEILKGASAAAIYGSLASNGVVIITTKKGSLGAPQFTASQRFGFFDLSEKFGMRTFETAAEVDDAFGAGTAADIGFQPGRSFDLEEALAGRNDLSSETLVTVSGGDQNTRYYGSGLWKNDEGIMPNTGFEKQTVRLNLDQSLADRVELSVGTNIIHTLAQRGLSNNDNASVSPYMVFPFTPNIVDLSRQGETFPENPFQRSNPLQTLSLMTNDEDVWRFIGSGRVSVRAIDRGEHRLELIGRGGADFFNQENKLLFPAELQFEPLDGQPGTSLLTASNNLNINLGGSAVYTYAPASGAYVATTSAGVSYLTSDLDISRVESRNLAASLGNIDLGTNVDVRALRERVKSFGFYVQEEFLALEDRLLLTAGLNVDQHSANADPEELFFYPKLAGSYRFLNPQANIDELKLRLAYGETGNPPLYGQRFTPLAADRNIQGLPSLVVAGTVGSPDLHSERQKEIEGGFDATLFAGRGTFEFTAYQKTISDLLLEREIAPSSGFNIEVFNGGRLRTRGVDVALGVVPVQTPDVSWLFRTTFALSRSEITDLPVPTFQPRSAGFGVDLGSFQIEKGKSATQIVGNIPVCTIATNVPCTGAVADSSFVGAVGDANPDFKVGFVNDISWRRFKVYFLWDWQQGGSVVNLTKLLFDAGGNTKDWDQSVTTNLLRDDDTVAQDTVIPRGLERLVRFGRETGVFVEDVTFLKLRELTIAYDLPASIVGSLWGAARYVRLSVSGRNLLTFTGYTGLDPEVSNFGNQSIGRNIDVAPFPPSRSFWFSVELGF